MMMFGNVMVVMVLFCVILLGCLMMITVVSYVNWSWRNGNFNRVWLLVNDWHVNFLLVNHRSVNNNGVGNRNRLFNNIRNFLLVNDRLWNRHSHFIRDLLLNMNWVGSVYWDMTVEEIALFFKLFLNLKISYTGYLTCFSTMYGTFFS
jgi:hypothetical protein